MELIKILSLRSLLTTLKASKLPIKTSYKIMKLIEFFESEAEFYQTEFNAIIEEYGEKGEDGNYQITEDGAAIKIVEGREEECNKALVALQNVHCDLPEIKFELDEFEGVEITPENLSVMMPFIEE